MPKLVSEIASGQQFSRSSTEGKVSDSQVRAFRILLGQPGEVVDVQDECGITIGAKHPLNTNIYCVSWDVKFDGDSRTVLIATFNYQSTASSTGDDKNDQPPEIRPANWSTSTSLLEVPARWWHEVSQNGEAVIPAKPIVNPVKDMYDGVSRFEAIVTINIEQFEPTDPTRHSLYAGCVNTDSIAVGSLQCFPGSLMFRGVQSRPTVESWGSAVRRGWTAGYEFAFRRNHTKGIYTAGATYDGNIGWDIAVPQTGFSVINLDAGVAQAAVEVGSMALKHGSDGKIEGWPNSPEIVAGTDGKKVRGMVLVHAFEDGGASQLPCAQPIPLNDNGTPRARTAEPPVIVKRYRANDAIDFTQTFRLRLQ